MNIKPIKAGTHDYGPFGSIRYLVAEVEGFGKVYAIRQGGLGLWACPARIKMSREQEEAFDAAMDAAWEGLSHDKA